MLPRRIFDEIGLAVPWVVTYSLDGAVYQRTISATKPKDVRYWMSQNLPGAEIKEIVQEARYDELSSYAEASV